MPDYRHPEAPPDDYAPVLDWDLFNSHVFRWAQDQHVGIIGPTEQGKSNLAYHLLRQRSYVAYMGIKSRDRTLDAFAARGGYVRTLDWPPKTGNGASGGITGGMIGGIVGGAVGGMAQGAAGGVLGMAAGGVIGGVIGGITTRRHEPEWEEMPRRLVWPDASDRRTARPEQQRVFGSMLDDIWGRGYAAIVWDDFWYLVRILGMELDAKQNLLNARSAQSAQVIIAQRGGGNRMVELYDQPTHLFFARESDPRNLQLLGPASSPRRGFVANLDRYQFLYENTRTQDTYRVTAPLLET